MLVAGIDPGLTNTGLVMMNQEFEAESFTLIQVDPSPAQRLYEIEQAVDSVLRPARAKQEVTVFIEGYAYGAKYQRESLAELGGVLRRYFFLNKIEYWVIPPLNVKQFVTGSSRANKNYMKKMTKEKWGQAIKSDDVCDAYGLARIGQHVMQALVPPRGEEHKVVGEILHYAGHYKEPNTARRAPKKRS